MWYRYRVSGDQLLDSLQNKRITGFRLRWRVENPAAMMATLTKPGSWIKTPRLGQCNFSGSYFKANHTYKATLQFPSDLVRQVGSGVLVVKLIADTGKEMEGLLENVKLFERARYSLYTEIKKMGGSKGPLPERGRSPGPCTTWRSKRTWGKHSECLGRGKEGGGWGLALD